MNRPMTGIRGAGYTGGGAKSGTSAGRKGLFDPLNSSAGTRGTGGGSPAGLDGSAGAGGRREETPEDKIKALEKKVNELIEESCFANSRGDLSIF